ncbi:MAG: hypothetical protein U1F98_06605 [Verrucomicrobiota bacterium]
MKRFWILFPAALALAATVYWLAAGAHRGWTRTSLVRVQVDEVTGIEGRTYVPGFVPGIDFLAASWGASALLGAAGWFVARRFSKST